MSPIDKNALVNPTLLLEVTSSSTEDYDRGDKLSHYKQLRSLQAVLFLSHRSRRVTIIERQGAGWDERDLRGGEAVPSRLRVSRSVWMNCTQASNWRANRQRSLARIRRASVVVNMPRTSDPSTTTTAPILRRAISEATCSKGTFGATV